MYVLQRPFDIHYCRFSSKECILAKGLKWHKTRQDTGSSVTSASVATLAAWWHLGRGDSGDSARPATKQTPDISRLRLGNRRLLLLCYYRHVVSCRGNGNVSPQVISSRGILNFDINTAMKCLEKGSYWRILLEADTCPPMGSFEQRSSKPPLSEHLCGQVC